MDALGICSPDGAFGLSGTADRNMCLLVGLLRGVLFWRCCSALKGETKKEEDGGIPVGGPSRSIVARDRFGNEIARSDGLDLSDDQISLLVLQPLTQHSLPLNGTRVNTWACHIVVLVLKQRQSLHRHLLFSQLLTSEFDDTVSCLLKALQPTCDYEGYADFLEQLIPFSRLFACLASTCEDVRVRISELSMIRALIQMFVTHPSLTTSNSIACMNLTLAVCQLLHGLSRSIRVIHTVFSDVSIINYLTELSNRLIPTVNSNPCHAEIALATTSTLVNLQLCQLPNLDESRVKSIDVFHSLLNVRDGSSALSLRLNGVWGLSSAAAVSGTTRILNRAETIERLDAPYTIPKAIALCNEVLSRIGDCEMRSVIKQVEMKVVFETSGCVLNSKPDQTHVEEYFVQKSLLLLRNMLALKEVSVSEYSESVYALLGKVFASDQSVNAKYEAMMILANLLTNAGARSQFWLQTELIQALAANITLNSDMSLLCGAILVAVNILDVPEPLASTVGGDSPGELFTQILSLLLFDNSRSHCSSYKQPTASSWCRHSSFHSSSGRRYHRTFTNITTGTVSPTLPRQSPEPMETTDSLTVAEVAPQEKALLHLISAFLDLFHTYSDSSSLTTHIVGSSMTRQMFKEVWDWQYQCGRGNGADSDDEHQQQPLSSGSRRRCKRIAITTPSTPSTSHYRSIGSPVLLVRRQEEAKAVMEKCLADPGGGLKAFLTGLMKKLNEDNDEEEVNDNYEGEQSSRSPPRDVDKDREGEESENPSCDVSGVSGEQEGGNEDDYEDN
nr:armadillo repeat containing protein 8 [Hymenolepis microstoma]